MKITTLIVILTAVANAVGQGLLDCDNNQGIFSNLCKKVEEAGTNAATDSGLTTFAATNYRYEVEVDWIKKPGGLVWVKYDATHILLLKRGNPVSTDLFLVQDGRHFFSTRRFNTGPDKFYFSKDYLIDRNNAVPERALVALRMTYLGVLGEQFNGIVADLNINLHSGNLRLQSLPDSNKHCSTIGKDGDSVKICVKIY